VTATACPRIAYMDYDAAGRLVFLGSAPVPAAPARGQMLSLDPQRRRRARRTGPAVHPAIQETALREALTDIVADALVASHLRARAAG